LFIGGKFTPFTKAAVGRGAAVGGGCVVVVGAAVTGAVITSALSGQHTSCKVLDFVLNRSTIFNEISSYIVSASMSLKIFFIGSRRFSTR
jgi:hypothetical protein